MKNKAVWFTFLSIALLVFGYLAYDRLSKQKTIAIWEFVPTTALAVYKGSDCKECVDSVKLSAWVKLLERKLLTGIPDDSSLFETILFLVKESELISLHKTTKDDADFVFYTRIEVSKKLKKRFNDNIFVKQHKRVLDGHELLEVAYKDQTLTWVENDLFAVWSLSSLLIEDVIRVINSGQGGVFPENFVSVASLPSVKSDAGDLLINLKEFYSWWTGMNEEVSMKLPSLGLGSLLDVKRIGNSLVLNGFSTIDSTDSKSLLYLFEGQSPTASTFKNYVPNDAQYVINFGFSDSRLLGEKIQRSILKEERDLFLNKLNLNNALVGRLYDGLGKGLTVVSVESLAGRSASILLIDIKQVELWENELNNLTRIEKQDTLFVEQFSNYKIRRIPSGSFLKLMFPFLQTSFDEIYFVLVDNEMIMSDNLNGLKMLLKDFEEENTWGKSVEKNRFLESTLLESNISFLVDPVRSRNMLMASLNPSWRKFISQESTLFSQLGLSAFQFSFLNANFYTNLCLTFQKGVNENTHITENSAVALLPMRIKTKPFVVKNHKEKSFEILVQDSTDHVYLVNMQGEVLWNKKLDGPIRGDVFQIDYFSNGKLQLFLCTDKSIHLIDRLGNYVKSFPVLVSFNTDRVRVIDYDHSKKYRYLFSDRKGVLRMTDKDGQLLEGWIGVNTEGELLVPAKHYRIDAKDYIAALNTKGIFGFYSRRGELVSQFPVDLNGRPEGDFYLEEGGKNQEPAFIFIHTDGFRVRMNLTGKIVSNETLIRTSAETTFQLVCEENERAYIIARQDSKALVLLSNDLKELVRNEYVGRNKVEIKVYDFGAGSVYYTIIDQDQNLAYLYNVNGRLLTKQPVSCEHLSLFFTNNQLWMATTSEQHLRLSIIEQ